MNSLTEMINFHKVISKIKNIASMFSIPDKHDNLSMRV